jgi:prepilin-type N-terminal cleavage/methylation domain-containing protein
MLPIGVRNSNGFSLVELLTVLVIISILTATSASVVPSLFRSSQVDANVSNLSGIFEQARETAISSNTYVYVLFTDQLTTSPGGGVGVVTVESQDGTDSLNNFSPTLVGTLSSSVSISSVSNLMVLRKMQILPGIQLTSTGSITTISNLPTPGSSLQGSMNLILTAGGSNYPFTQGVEFTPDGEARVASWYDSVGFGIKSSLNSQSPDVVVMELTRLTGRLTVYRP